MALKLPTFLYIMSCDVYYATYLSEENSNQSNIMVDVFVNVFGGVGLNVYGESVKIWELDRNERSPIGT